ncbi:MAG: carbon storage regulator [Planctomycetales bacterium]
MLVLTRQAGQAIVIGDRLVVTVVYFTTELMELSLKEMHGAAAEVVVGKLNEAIPLPGGGEAIMITAFGDRVRLGLEFPDGTHIARWESWNERSR